MTETNARLTFAIELARRAGKEAASWVGKTHATFKGAQDYLTEADGAVEALVRRLVAETYPDDPLFGEEAGGTMAERMWLVDPIDGTANFARAIPHYCISIAYLEQGRPVLGVIYDPSHDECYSASVGQGAFRNGQPISVTSVDCLDQTTVELGWSPRLPVQAYTDMVTNVLEAGAAFRRAGSGALGLAYVADGRADGYAELHINSWDCAAGIVLVQEAGGLVNDFFAGDGLRQGGSLIAAGRGIFQEFSIATGIGEKPDPVFPPLP